MRSASLLGICHSGWLGPAPSSQPASCRAALQRGTQWVGPVVGARIRRQIAPGKELRLEGDVGGFGAGSEFSWQVVATYGFDVNCFGTPLHSYRLPRACR
jgi:hypothetical protein